MKAVTTFTNEDALTIRPTPARNELPKEAAIARIETNLSRARNVLEVSSKFFLNFISMPIFTRCTYRPDDVKVHDNLQFNVEKPRMNHCTLMTESDTFASRGIRGSAGGLHINLRMIIDSPPSIQSILREFGNLLPHARSTACNP